MSGYKFLWNPFTRNLDLVNKITGGGGVSNFTDPRVVFFEKFAGDGFETQFTLTNGIENASFFSGSWQISRILSTLPSHVTKTDYKAIYDSANIFTRNKITVASVGSGTGLVTLTHPPINLEEFYIWYWYEIESTDILEDYYRPDFVASMEGEIGSSDFILASNTLPDTTAFNGILSGADDTVQKALDTIDDHTHSGGLAVSVNCLSSDNVGDLVYVTSNMIGGLWQVASADPHDYTKVPAVGVLISKSTSTSGIIQVGGPLVGIFSGLQYDEPCFVGSSGISQTPPVPASGQLAAVQEVAFVLDTNAVYLTGNTEMIFLRG